MGWLSRNNLATTDALSNDMLNNLANDIRHWGGDVNGGGFVLSNVLVVGGQIVTSPVRINNDPTNKGSLQFAQGGLMRWTVDKDATAETGGNAGSNLAINRYDDAGAVLGAAVTVQRSTGRVGIANGAPAYPLDVVGDINITGSYRVNGASIGALYVPTARQVIAGAGMTGGGALTADVTLTANVRTVQGRAGDVVVTLAELSGVPTSRLVTAGGGLSGGGALSGDVTLTANVKTVFGRTGDVVLTPADLTGAGGVPSSRTITAGAGLTGGGDLSADRSFAVVADSTTQRHRISKDGTLVGTRQEINFITGANVVLNVADNAGSNRVDCTINSTGGSGGGSQTPWLQNIEGGGFSLQNCGGALFKPPSGTLTVQFQDGVPSFTTRIVQTSALLTFSTNAAPMELDANTNGGVANQIYLATSGNVGIRTATPGLQCEIKGTFGPPATSGAVQTGIARFSQTTGAGCLDFGWRTSSDGAWVQATHSGNLANVFGLFLNPNGGNVGVNTSTPSLLNSASTPHTAYLQTKTALIVGGTTQNGNDDGLLQLGSWAFVSGNNWNGFAVLGCNFAVKSVGNTDTFYTPVTHPGQGYGGIVVHGNGGINLYTAGGATTAGAAVAPAPRLTITANGPVGINNSAPQAFLDVNGFTRIGNQSGVPSSGAGIEIYYNGTYGQIQTYDRTAAQYKPLYLNGSIIGMNGNATITASDGQLLIVSNAPSGATKAAGLIVNNAGGDATQGGFIVQRRSTANGFEANLLTVNLANAYLGINVLRPTAQIHLAQPCAAGVNNTLLFQNLSGIDDATMRISMVGYNGSTLQSYIDFQGNAASNWNSELRFGTSGVQRTRILASGEMIFQVNGTNVPDAYMPAGVQTMYIWIDGPSNAICFKYRKADGTYRQGNIGTSPTGP